MVQWNSKTGRQQPATEKFRPMASQFISPSQFRRIMLQSLLLPVLLLALVAGLLVVQITDLVAAAGWEDHSDQVIAQADQTLTLAVDAETGERGYLVGGDRAFLGPYQRASRNIGGAFDQLAALVADNREQSARVKAMRAGYERWANEARLEMNLRDRGGDYRAYFNRSRGKALMDALRAQFTAFGDAERALRVQRAQAVHRATLATLWATFVSALVAAVLLAVFSRRRLRSLSSQYDTALISEVEAREMLSATLLGIGDAVLVTDARGRVTLLNSVAERLTGWTRADAQGQDSKRVFPILNETTREEVVSPIKRVIREGVVVGLANHTVLVRRDGSEIPIDDSGAPIRDAAGILAGVVLVFRDVSERRSADVRLQESLRQLRDSLRREQTIAATLQRAMLQLPPPDAFPGMSIGTVYEPAHLEGDGDTLEVGGDFLDAFPLSESQVALVVGDVSGKGLVAAARTAEVLYTLRGLLREHDAPAVALMRLNHILCESQHLGGMDEGFICVALAVVDTARRTVAFSTAGAEPPLIVRAGGGAEEIALQGTPLAVTAKAEYQVVEVALNVRDRIVMVTDGITEARRGREFLGYDGLLRLAREASARESAQQVAQTILSEAKTFAGGLLRDDACILVARLE